VPLLPAYRQAPSRTRSPRRPDTPRRALRPADHAPGRGLRLPPCGGTV